jgi:hypothetical protein
MDDVSNVIGELEFAARAYEVSTQYLIDALQKAGDEVPPRILAACMELADAINSEWP